MIPFPDIVAIIQPEPFDSKKNNGDEMINQNAYLNEDKTY